MEYLIAVLDPTPEALQLPLNLFGGLPCGHVCIVSSPSGVRIQMPRYLVRAGGLRGGEKADIPSST